MKNILKLICGLIAIISIAVISSCNKLPYNDVPGSPAASTLKTVDSTLKTESNLSLFNYALTKANLRGLLAPGESTVFAPTDAAFGLLGITSPAAIDAALANPAAQAQLVAAFRYHIVPQKLAAAQITEAFPNQQLPTRLMLQPPFFTNSINVSRRGSAAWANNVPVVQADLLCSNGVIHKLGGIAIPPSITLDSALKADPNTTYLRAAIARADSGQTGNGVLANVLANPGASLTVFAPSNAAFQATLTALIAQALIAQGVPPATATAQATALASTPAVFSNPALFAAMPAQTVRGIVAYHLLAPGARINPTSGAPNANGKAFIVNLPTAPTFIPTAINPLQIGAGVFHPGLRVSGTVTGGVGVSLTAQGPNPTTNPVAATNTSPETNCINGVLHKIDRVLLPQ